MSEKNEEAKSTEPIEETEKVEKIENAKSKENKEKTENTKNNETIEKEEKETKKEKKGKKGKVILILIIILLVIALAAVGGYFAYQYIEESKPIEQEWADTYYNYIKGSDEEEASESRKIQNDSKIGFIEVADIEDPVMFVEYEKDDEYVSDVYYINEGKVSNVINLGVGDIELLYDIDKKEYDWYIHTKTDTTDTYTKLSAQIFGEDTQTTEETSTEKNSETTNNTEYTFTKGEEVSVETVDGDKISMPKFDTVFIETDVEIDTVDYNENMTNKELKETIEEGVDKYKTEEEIITEDTKNKVTNKENEITEKQEEMKQAEEEKEKAEEEARKKAEEEAKKGLKVGNYTLKYGTYTCDVDGVGSVGGTYVIKEDGTFSFSNNWSNINNERFTDTGSGTYKTYFSTGDDYDSTQAWIIEFNFSNYYSTYLPSNSYKTEYNAFDVTGNNKFEYRQSVGTFTYQGN